MWYSSYSVLQGLVSSYDASIGKMGLFLEIIDKKSIKTYPINTFFMKKHMQFHV